MTFIETLIKDPTSIRNYPTKQIDVLNHDFGSENLEDRIYSLLSDVINVEYIDIGDKEINCLNNMFPGIIFIKVNSPSYGCVISTIKFEVYGFYITIRGIEDDYYILSLRDVYYKCDQLHGLCKCIEDIFIPLVKVLSKKDRS